MYGRIHVGNARPYVVFSLLKRFLEHEGYDATLVVNITDVNDKIYDAARERGVPSAELAREMTAAYVEDTDRLGLGRPDHEPKASETIAEIVALIEALVESDHAYERGGDVYFRVPTFPGYGKLSNRPLEEMQQGEGDDAAELKESPAGLRALEGAQGGRGHLLGVALGRRPARLAHRVLGDGRDRARHRRSRCTAAARTWSSRTTRTRSRRPRRPAASRSPAPGCTTAWCRWATEKMAKSVGNIRLLHGALEQFGRDAFLMWMVGAHYRKPVAYNEEALEDATRAVARVRDVVRRLDPDAPGIDDLVETFFDALADDFNTPQARAVLFDWVAEANRRMDAGEPWAPAGSARCSTRSGSRRCSRRMTRHRRSSSGSPPNATRRAQPATSSAPTGSATSSPRAAGRSATPPTARGSCGNRDRLRPQPGARGAARQAARAARVRHRARRAGGVARRASRR